MRVITPKQVCCAESVLPRPVPRRRYSSTGTSQAQSGHKDLPDHRGLRERQDPKGHKEQLGRKDQRATLELLDRKGHKDLKETRELLDSKDPRGYRGRQVFKVQQVQKGHKDLRE